MTCGRPSGNLDGKKNNILISLLVTSSFFILHLMILTILIFDTIPKCWSELNWHIQNVREHFETHGKYGDQNGNLP